MNVNNPQSKVNCMAHDHDHDEVHECDCGASFESEEELKRHAREEHDADV